jgi:hypothetical protein
MKYAVEIRLSAMIYIPCVKYRKLTEGGKYTAAHTDIETTNLPNKLTFIFLNSLTIDKYSSYFNICSKPYVLSHIIFIYLFHIE